MKLSQETYKYLEKGMKKMKKRVGALALILACSVYANDGVTTENEEQFFEDAGMIRLEETTISGDGFENTIRDTPKNITIVTAKDIEESGAKDVVEAVKSVPGVKVGNGTKNYGIIDIRGQGAAAGSNTAIIVDGVKMNSMDMSGFNLYSIPIETIEKIEIIPSGASVIYGDNTVGGAINIITKNGKGKDYLSLQSEAGSYNELNSNLGFGTTAGDFKIFGNVGRKNTDGYRDNGFYKADDVTVGTKYQINEHNSLTLKYDYHKDKMGLPGSLTEDQVKNDPKQTTTPDNWGKNETNRFNVGYNYKNNNLEIVNNASYYNKKDSSYSGQDMTTNNFSNDLKLKYTTDRNKFITGFDISSGKLDDDSSYLSAFKWSKKESAGIFVSNTFSITDSIDITGGIRQQHTEYKYSGTAPTDTYNNTVYDLALNYKYSDTGSTFISYGTDFRTPNIDELGLTYPNKKLKPQTGENIELGLKDYIGETFISMAVFHKIIKDEIYYGKYNGQDINRNYDDPNKKIGFEFLTERKFEDVLTLSASYTYLDSKIDGGTNKGKKTPGVPTNKLSLGAKYDFTKKFSTNLGMNFVGESYAYGDLANSHDKVDSYITIDLDLSYKLNPSFDIYGGIKNLTGEEYFEYVGESSWNGRYYYPAAERRYYIGFKYTM